MPSSGRLSSGLADGEEPPPFGGSAGTVAPGVALVDMPAPVFDGEALGDGLAAGLLVGDEDGADDGDEVEVTGCGVVGDGVAAGPVTAADGDELGVTVAVAAVAGEVAHGCTGAESSAMAGMFGFVTPGPGGAAPIMAACAAGVCVLSPPGVVAAGPRACGLAAADWHRGPRFVPAGAMGGAGAGTPEAGDAPGRAAGDDGLAAAVPLPSRLFPSTLPACPPVSTLELACTTACRSGVTASVAETTNAVPASTATGRNQPGPSAPRSAGRDTDTCPPRNGGEGQAQ